MNVDFENIKANLQELGIVSGDRVLVHSSCKSIGPIEGGANTFIEALKEVVGKEGTLLFPTFTYDYVNKNNPVFDVNNTVSHCGIITEIFRKMTDVKRSVHPTHSVAVWGKDRDWFVADHYYDNVCVGKNSPIFKLREKKGKILFLGCTLRPNTSIHGMEILFGTPYSFRVDYSDPRYYRKYTCIDEDDKIYRQEFYHMFMEEWGYEQAYDKLEGLMEIQKGKVLKADSYLLDAELLWSTVLSKMKEDPYYFVRKG